MFSFVFHHQSFDINPLITNLLHAETCKEYQVSTYCNTEDHGEC